MIICRNRKVEVRFLSKRRDAASPNAACLIVALILFAAQALVAADPEGFEWFDGKMPAKVPGDFYILRYEHPDGMYTNRWRNGMTRWLFTEVRQLKDGVTIVEDGVLRQEKAGYPGVNWAKWIRPRARKIRVKFVDGNYTLAGDGREAVPEGFTALFNGRDLDGWKGTTTEEWFDYYNYRAKMPAEKRAALQAKADGLMRSHWHVRDGALFFDGLPGGSSLAAAKDYGDFDFSCDWRLLRVNGDSGFYVRGLPQVQIWDPDTWGGIGSGGLYNNVRHLSSPTVRADRPIGDWNRTRIRMLGDRVWVWLNGTLVVDGVPLDNCREPGKPIPECEQLELQCHGDPIEFRNLFIRELLRMKLSVFEWHVADHAMATGKTVAESAAEFKALGIDGFDAGWKVDKKLLDGMIAGGLRPVCFYGSLRFADPDWREQGRAYIARAKEYGVRTLMAVPAYTDGKRDLEAEEFPKIVEGLGEFVLMARTDGLDVVTEDVGGKVSPTSKFGNLRRLFDNIPDLGFAFDSGNFDNAGFGQDPLEALELYKSRVRLVHLKDHSAGAVESAAAMGEGTVPNLEAVKRLRAAGYDGWFTLELFGPRDPFGLCRKSVEYFKRNLEGVEW